MPSLRVRNPADAMALPKLQTLGYHQTGGEGGLKAAISYLL